MQAREGEYREYATDEQRRQPGCIAGRMQTNFGDTTLERDEELKNDTWQRDHSGTQREADAR